MRLSTRGSSLGRPLRWALSEALCSTHIDFWSNWTSSPGFWIIFHILPGHLALERHGGRSGDLWPNRQDFPSLSVVQRVLLSHLMQGRGNGFLLGVRIFWH